MNCLFIEIFNSDNNDNREKNNYVYYARVRFNAIFIEKFIK